LNTKANAIGMMMIFDTRLGSVPGSWSNLTNTVSGLPTLGSTYVWIKKVAL